MTSVEDALTAVDGWLRGRTPLANRQDVAVALAAEVRRLRAQAAMAAFEGGGGPGGWIPRLALGRFFG